MFPLQNLVRKELILTLTADTIVLAVYGFLGFIGMFETDNHKREWITCVMSRWFLITR